MGDESRQRIERVPGSRRARLTPAPGTDPAPDVVKDSAKDAAASASRASKGPNDERLIQDIPPHY